MGTEIENINLSGANLVSIQLMSPASGNWNRKYSPNKLIHGFHSINVPSEWELNNFFRDIEESAVVSIQLMSPASGNLNGNLYILIYTGRLRLIYVSIQLMSPASGN